MEFQDYDLIFSDASELFLQPAEPDPGDALKIRIRTSKDSARRVSALFTKEGRICEMIKAEPGELFDYYEAETVCTGQPVCYAFVIEFEGGSAVYQKTGLKLLPEVTGNAADVFMPAATDPFVVTPGFHVPEWSKGAVQYQIFVDRFCNGDASNDVCSGEYYYVNGHSQHMNWNDPVSAGDIRHFYGGDLKGVKDKLDYLQDLGVEAIYLNPIFVSPSSHKYDIQDYEHIDPHFGVIVEDENHQMQEWEHHNGYAPQYIKRTASKANLEASDKLFAALCEDIHSRGMKIILDGVFNHCGSFNKWLDREGIYVALEGYEKGAHQSEDSPYREYFKYGEPHPDTDGEMCPYEGWWNYSTLPKLNYEESPSLCEEIYRIAEKWAKPPYSIDGWRLDVAADLGHTEAFNHKFWAEFRRRVKAVNPDLVILAEHYGDPSPWLLGDQWDSIMNYDAFMEPVTYFLTGMEKHSDRSSMELKGSGAAFFDTMRKSGALMQRPSLLCAMNELSNHDHSRFLTRTSGNVGRLETKGSEAASEGVDKQILMQAAVIQMTWPGAPTIYYGDEAGLCGFTDPDCRRTYPWSFEDQNLIAFHKALISVRKSREVFKTGSTAELASGNGFIAYARFSECDCAVTAVNTGTEEKLIELNVRKAGIADGTQMETAFLLIRGGFEIPSDLTSPAENGIIGVVLPPESAVILLKKDY